MTTLRNPPPEAERTRTCSLWLDRIVYGRFHDGAEVTLSDAKENIAVTARLTRGRRALLMIDLRPCRSQSSEARNYFAGPEATQVSLAVALIIGSPISRVIGNFFLGFNRPEVPTRLFTSENEAEGWLNTFSPSDRDAAP